MLVPSKLPPTLALDLLAGRGSVPRETGRGTKNLRYGFFSPSKRGEGSGRRMRGGCLVERRTYR
ncbi:hypothetical protein SAMN02927900_02568 [Rhizobium mongolense subsp. loessense]|uniref:Uncharacterized protein n=1 Tax=Rhizobium mongolense subsp. loessense TaxID=158890 RepID=A0A1G4RF22_9HYPH|nr:hypothetical protein SAMN02927900_02568 [Rhizobium mongolense subsp. loessense]